MPMSDPYARETRGLIGGEDEKPRGMREVPDQASIRQQFERFEKLLAVNNEALERLHHIISPMLSPEEEIEKVAVAGFPGQEGIRASEYTNLVWDLANRLERQIERLHSLTNRLEV